MASADVTQLLAAASGGDREALSRVLPLVYEDLREQASRFLRSERSGHTLQATALVHEAYMRLVDQTRVDWQSRGHFLAVASVAMRRILVNHARDRGRLKRGGERRRVELTESAAVTAEPDVDLEALDDALTRLSTNDPRAGRVVELRYFGGLSVEQTAEVLGVAPATVKRDWTIARTWLLREMSENGDRSGDEPRDGRHDA